MNFILKGSQFSALQLNGWFKSMMSIQEYRNDLQNSYYTCTWMIWYMYPIQCEELKINHLTLLLVVTMPYACWYLWREYYIEDFKWRFLFQFGLAFWRVEMREVYFEGPNRDWRALKTSILNTDLWAPRRSCPYKFGTHWWLTMGMLLMYNVWSRPNNPHSHGATSQWDYCSHSLVWHVWETQKKVVLLRCCLLVNMTNGVKLSYYRGDMKT